MEMKSLAIIILSPDTYIPLIQELEEMLKHGDLNESQTDEIATLMNALQECDEVRLQLSA